MARKINIIIFFLVFVFFIFFHFYNIEKRVGFSWDQESYSYQVKNIVENHKLTLIGPRSADIKGFFLGPYFIYLLVPFYLITHLHPWALIIFVVIYNLLFFSLSFFFLYKIFNISTAIFFMIFWLINHQLITYDIVPWNPIFIPMGVITCWYFIKQIIKKNKVIDWLLLGLSSGIFINMHFSFIFILIFNFLFIFFHSLKNNFKDWKKILVFLLSFVVIFIPLLLFDLRHNFLNSKLFFDFFFNKQSGTSADLLAWIPVFGNLVKPSMLINNNLAVVIFYVTILILMLYVTFKNKNIYTKLFFRNAIIVWLIFPIFFSLYGKRPSEYYFLFLMPFVFITIIIFFNTINKKYFLWLILGLLFIFNIKSLSLVTREDRFGLFYKDMAIKKLKSIVKNKNKLNISYKVPIGENNGYNYLIEYYQIRQSGDFNDPLLEIMVPSKPGNIKVGNIGLKIPKEFK